MQFSKPDQARTQARIRAHIARRGYLPPDIVPDSGAVEIAEARRAVQLEEATSIAEATCDEVASLAAQVGMLTERVTDVHTMLANARTVPEIKGF